jgi:DNA-directed RNA polymerase specialized sigma subunit
MKQSFTELSDLSRSILDELSDGQWHPFYKINKKIERGSTKAKEFRTVLSDELERLVDYEVLLSGENESYRFRSDRLESWRAVSDNPQILEKQYQPRWFGGILEDDGWELAPLKSYDLVHFKADSTLTRQTLHQVLGGKIALIQIDSGLYRVFSKDGQTSFEKIKELKENYPQYDIRSMRLEKDLKRRDLEDLPNLYLSDLCKYYGKFAKILLRPYNSSIVKHIPDHDDIQQQIYLWVLDAVQRYDDSKSIPFAAYLGTSLTKWVFNLNRTSFGRSVADAELKHSRAINNFKIMHGREPKVEELAEALGEDVASIKRDSLVINTVVNLRNISTIHTDEADIPIPSNELVDDNLDSLVSNTLLSAAIITACKEDMKNRNANRDLSGLLGIYYENWGQEISTKKIKMWTRSAKTQDTIKRVLVIVAQKLRKN